MVQLLAHGEKVDKNKKKEIEEEFLSYANMGKTFGVWLWPFIPKAI